MEVSALIPSPSFRRTALHIYFLIDILPFRLRKRDTYEEKKKDLREKKESGIRDFLRSEVLEASAKKKKKNGAIGGLPPTSLVPSRQVKNTEKSFLSTQLHVAADAAAPRCYFARRCETRSIAAMIQWTVHGSDYVAVS